MNTSPLTQDEFQPLFINARGFVNFEEDSEGSDKPWIWDPEDPDAADALVGSMTFYRFSTTEAAGLFGDGVKANPRHEPDDVYLIQRGRHLLVTFTGDAEVPTVEFLEVNP